MFSRPLGFDVSNVTVAGLALPTAKFETLGYFATLGIPLAAGRLFDVRDGLDAPRVAIVNESAARLLFGSPADALGRRLRIADDTWRDVAGVMGDTRSAFFNTLEWVDQSGGLSPGPAGVRRDPESHDPQLSAPSADRVGRTVVDGRSPAGRGGCERPGGGYGDASRLGRGTKWCVGTVHGALGCAGMETGSEHRGSDPRHYVRWNRGRESPAGWPAPSS